MLAAGNAGQGGGDTSVRKDAAEGLLRLSCRAGCDASTLGAFATRKPYMELEPEVLLEIERKQKVHEAWEEKLQAEAAKTYAEESQRYDRLPDINGIDRATNLWLKRRQRSGAPETTLEQGICGRPKRRGVKSPQLQAGRNPPSQPHPQPQPQPTTSKRVTRRSGPPEVNNLFGLDDTPKARSARTAPKPKAIWKMSGPMMGHRSFVVGESELIGVVSEIDRPDSRGVESGVAVGAAAPTSAQGYSHADQRSPGMGSIGSAGSGGADVGRDPRSSIGAGARGSKRRRQEVLPGASSTGAHAAGGGGIASAGYGSGYEAGYESGYGSGYGSGSGVRAGVGARAGAGAGEGATDYNRHLKRARVSGGASGAGSIDGVTDGADRSGSSESFPGAEGESGAGAMGCGGVSAKLTWKGGDDEDVGFGGRGGGDSGGGSLDGGSSNA